MADDALTDDALLLAIEHGINRMMPDQTPRLSYAECSALYTSFFNYIMVNAHGEKLFALGPVFLLLSPSVVHRRLCYSQMSELLEKRVKDIKDVGAARRFWFSKTQS